MVDLVTETFPCAAFEKIYKTIPPRLNQGIDKREFHEDLYQIIGNTFKDENWWAHDHEHGPTIGERIKLISGFAHDIEMLIRRFDLIEKHYPTFQCPETGNESQIIPKWLSQFTDKFDLNELELMSKKLRGFETDGKELTHHLSGRGYYVEELIKVFEKHTATETTAEKDGFTDFTFFAMAFFEHAPLNLKKKIGKRALYDEHFKIKARAK